MTRNCATCGGRGCQNCDPVELREISSKRLRDFERGYQETCKHYGVYDSDLKTMREYFLGSHVLYTTV